MASSPEASDLLRKLAFPPIPEALRVIREEHAKSEPDMARIGAVVARDVALAAEVLRVINSPAFGRRRTIDSIPTALALLGLDNVINLVSSAALRAGMSGLARINLDRFWDTASDVAFVGARVAKEYTGLSPDTAYTLGLFHDCGIPLLMGLFADYGAVTKDAVNGGRVITEAERERFGVSHNAVGFHVARHWNLPDQIAQAILHHHDFPTVLTEHGLGEGIHTLVAVLKIGEHVSESFRGLAFDRQEDGSEWERIKEAVLGHLAISETEFGDLRDSLVEMLGRR